MITLYQFKHGLAAHKDIEEALLCSRMFQFIIRNIKLALKLCHSKQNWVGYNNLIGGMGWQIFFYITNYRCCIMIFNHIYKFVNLLNTNTVNKN